jgi:hypothetical protein
MTVGSAQSATVSVTCPRNTISGAIAKASLSSPLTINLRGACVENVDVPPGLVVYINGATGSTLKPSSTAAPALRVRGHASIYKLAISGALANNTLVEVIQAGYLSMDTSSVQSSTVDTVMFAGENSTLAVFNTNIIGGTQAAFSMSGATADFYAYASKTMTISSPNNNGGDSIGCYQSSLHIAAANGSTVVIGPGPQGLSARACEASIGSLNGTGLVRFTGNTDVAVRGKAGDSINLRNVTISNNPGKAVEVSAGVVEFDASTVASNGAGLFAKRQGIIYFNNIYGTSTVTGPDPFRCYQNGAIYADEDSISGVTEVEDCFTIGGSIIP